MQVSKRIVSGLLKKQVEKMWCQLIADIRTAEEAELIMGGLLSETEMAAVTKRLAIGYWLSNGRTYDNIRENLKVSSATIAAIQQESKKPEWVRAMQLIKADEWATKWEEKIKQKIPLWSRSLFGNRQKGGQ